MTPAPGWYPDPSGTAQLRFWDGQSWTSSTADAARPPAAPSYAATAPTTFAPEPAYVAQPGTGQQPTYAAQPTYSAVPGYDAQPSYSAIPQGWGGGPLGQPAQKSRRRKGLIALVSVVVVAAVAATVIPLTSGGGHSVPTTAKLTTKLLTSTAVGEIASGTFAASPPSDDDSDDDDTKTDCSDGGNIDAPKGADKADAGREFQGTGQFAEEDLSYTVGAAPLFTKLKTAMQSCHTLTIDGGQLTLSTLAQPPVSGADDTFGMQASGNISGVDFTFDIVAARFGNGVMMVTYGSADGASRVAEVSNQLLQAAAAKAKSAF
jgi:Protein of unknown function (DUF2510)